MSSQPPHALKIPEGSKAPDKESKAVGTNNTPTSTTHVKSAVIKPFDWYSLENQYFNGPKEKGAYASISVLDPIVTIERYRGKYHIAAAFNMETTILRYNTQKRLESQ
jgi:hypothetical protein